MRRTLGTQFVVNLPAPEKATRFLHCRNDTQWRRRPSLLETEDLLIDARAPGLFADAREATLGIRPEHLLVTAPAPGATTARVELIEPVGSVTYIDLALGDRSLRASVPGQQRFAVGQEVANRVPARLRALFRPRHRVAAERDLRGGPRVTDRRMGGGMRRHSRNAFVGAILGLPAASFA